MQHTVSEQRVIAAPVEDVWDVIANTARYAEWVDGVLEVTRDHGTAVVGGVYEERNRTLGPLTTSSTWTVREIEEHRLRVDAGTGFAPLHDLVNTFRFTPLDGGRATRMTYEVTFRIGLGPLSGLVARVLTRTLGGEFQRSMRALEDVLVAERAL